MSRTAVPEPEALLVGGVEPVELLPDAVALGLRGGIGGGLVVALLAERERRHGSVRRAQARMRVDQLHLLVLGHEVGDCPGLGDEDVGLVERALGDEPLQELGAIRLCPERWRLLRQ